MRHAFAALAIIALTLAACDKPKHGPDGQRSGNSEVNASNNISANSMFGSVQIRSVPDLCAGRVQLAQGAATVSDACFTGDTNVVLCTDASAANAVRCGVAKGQLSVAGTGADWVSYARVR
ncbi:MAG TPA: hypothetical protein VEU51_07690 [Candidatus Acidoferrales bacterium]|nr:hypothetical protein [Candidatus Acidoferrales bacterium]